MTQVFRGAELTHSNAGHLSFNALQTGMKLSDAYAAIEARVADLGVLQYSVLQPTLEQVFLSVSAQAAAAAAQAAAARTTGAGAAGAGNAVV